MHFVVATVLIVLGVFLLLGTEAFVSVEQGGDSPFTVLRQGEEMRRFITLKNKIVGVVCILGGVVVLVLPAIR